MTKKTTSSAPKTTTKAPRKAIAKEPKTSVDTSTTNSATTAKKPVTKKATKKEAVAPKLTKKESLARKVSTGSSGSPKILELCLLLDCTGSMGSWIQRSKDTLKEIIHSVKKENESLVVRVCFIGYRDIKDRNRFDIF